GSPASARLRSPGRGRCACGSRGCASPIAIRPAPWKRGVRPFAKPLDCVGSSVAGADADRLLDVDDEDLAVADAPRARGILDRLDDVLDERVLNHDLDLHL